MKNILTSALFLLAYVLVGCGGENGTTPGTDAGHDSGTTVTDAGQDSGTTIDAGQDSGTPDLGVDAGNPCIGTGGCFTSASGCTAASVSPANPDLWYLNHCNSGYCAPFDNATRIPGYVGQP